jgi:hypothetical protein
MKANRHKAVHRLLLGGALALGSVGVLAADAGIDRSSADAPMVLAQAATTQARSASTDPAAGFPPLEAGVRRAAAEGPDALRRYVWRTRMIYNYYMPDFVAAE